MAIAPTAKTAATSAKKVEKVSKPASAARKKVKNAPIASGTGRRKSAVARVWMRKGAGTMLINGREFNEYFTVLSANEEARASFEMFKITEGLLADVNVQGGGYTAQASAVKLGVARALLMLDETLRPELRKNGFLTVDAREKERKKPGQRGARAKFQFTKR
ncbi:30S ribosomal protein S9 [Candidatus Babeliales bacterium]|nr:30S ribosomal protein S9 [Candidatus Babeliales bacterium]MBP9843750.1 30S ribosomal protein S9 [Candidatus Babeliales bacterium]